MTMCICSEEYALRYCIGRLSKWVHYYPSIPGIPGIIIMPGKWVSSDCVVGLLLKHVDKDVMLVLALTDPMFRIVTRDELANQYGWFDINWRRLKQHD